MHLQTQLKNELTAINNASDRKYWADLDYGNYSDPSNVRLTLRAVFCTFA